MAKKPKPPDDPEQYARFLEAAKKAEASDKPEALDKALKDISRKKNP
jgi:hypothetical protein